MSTVNRKVIIKGMTLTCFDNARDLVDLAANEKKVLIAINAEKLLKSDNNLRKLTSNQIGYCDGIGAVLALKRKKEKNIVRIPGVELWLQIIEKYSTSKSFYLIGSTDEVIIQVVDKLKSKYKGIDIRGYRNGYFKNAEERLSTIADLVDKKPDFVFVAMGSPKQERFMSEMYMSHKATYQGLGGSFDVYSGKTKRAPKFLQKTGMEWSYRLYKNPHRIGRYLSLMRFFGWIVLGKV